MRSRGSRLPPDLPWSWREFSIGFWAGFGQMMAIMVGCAFLLPIVADTSSASLFSVYVGAVFTVVLSTIYGISKGDSRVREWRDKAVST